MIGFLLIAASAANFSPVSCDIGNAERVTLEALAADQHPRERCVAVRGLWSGDLLYRNRRDALGRAWQGDVPRIAVHTTDAIRARSLRPDFYTAIGNVFRCDDIPLDAGVLGGFCDGNPAGLYIATGDMRRERWPTIRSDR